VLDVRFETAAWKAAQNHQREQVRPLFRAQTDAEAENRDQLPLADFSMQSS
jgi:hypothetical protein